ncbi:MAG TPA: glycerophosphodiester phosphodiesterase [Methylomirabilota bacterium]|nr:glycerophosphodiester phosphodiesterase [Methylomirabilota bacterium]
MSARIRLAAHRGGALLWPENSLRAFRESIALGADLLELDLRLSADGRVVVVHDLTLERVSDAQGSVGERTAAELARVRLRAPDGTLSDEGIPTLEQVLELVAPSGTGLLLEVKGPTPRDNVLFERVERGEVRITPGPQYPGLVESTVAAVRAAGMLDRVNVMGFNPDAVRQARALRPPVAATFLVAAGHVTLVEAQPVDAVAWAAGLGATDVGLEHTLASAPVVAAAHAAGLRVGVWTVNAEADMGRMLDLGVDVLTTDRPDLARRVLGR